MTKKRIPIKNILITGATSGIGRATAAVFAKKGYNLIITGRREDRLNDIKSKFKRKYGVKVKTLVFDVRDKKQVKKSLASLKGEWANIDVLINNAGLAKGLDYIEEGHIDDWETMIDTNIKGLLYVTRQIAPKMVKRGTGHIVNICSTAGHECYAKGNVYCATKHAVDALTKGMRLDLYTKGIRVSQVSPAHVEETEFALNRFDGDTEKSKIYDDFNPLVAKDVAETIYFIVTRPRHVNIQDVLMMSTQQASGGNIDRAGRKYD
jgi:NADP-dependent 3-hydroxy acid dehydrogenase YdfG